MGVAVKVVFFLCSVTYVSLCLWAKDSSTLINSIVWRRMSTSPCFICSMAAQS